MVTAETVSRSRVTINEQLSHRAVCAECSGPLGEIARPSGPVDRYDRLIGGPWPADPDIVAALWCPACFVAVGWVV
jgi:hypothetical protein